MSESVVLQHEQKQQEEPEITAEMIEAGEAALELLQETTPSFLLVEEIYRAMLKHRPNAPMA